jgi:hypothetical protein
MVHRTALALMALVVVCTAASLWDAAPAYAEEPQTEASGSYGYYVQPGGGNGLGASLYPCPRPTPPLVGHTYISYAPLNPHEFLYPHHKRYVQSDCSGRTVTRARYHR